MPTPKRINTWVFKALVDDRISVDLVRLTAIKIEWTGEPNSCWRNAAAVLNGFSGYYSPKKLYEPRGMAHSPTSFYQVTPH